MTKCSRWRSLGAFEPEEFFSWFLELLEEVPPSFVSVSNGGNDDYSSQNVVLRDFVSFVFGVGTLPAHEEPRVMSVCADWFEEHVTHAALAPGI